MENFSKDISKEQIKQLPLIQFPGKIYLIEQIEQVSWAVNFLKKQSVLGFDTETRPSFKRGQSYKLSLVQLATDDQCFLFRINKLSFVDELKELFEQENVTKVGFDLNSDFHQLRKVAKIDFHGFVDLQKIAKQLGFKDVSLRKLTALVMSKRLSKRQRLSNWEAEPLTDAQKVYAATDAWVTLQLYKILKPYL